jgi:hypothetical protein
MVICSLLMPSGCAGVTATGAAAKGPAAVGRGDVVDAGLRGIDSGWIHIVSVNAFWRRWHLRWQSRKEFKDKHTTVGQQISLLTEPYGRT